MRDDGGAAKRGAGMWRGKKRRSEEWAFCRIGSVDSPNFRRGEASKGAMEGSVVARTIRQNRFQVNSPLEARGAGGRQGRRLRRGKRKRPAPSREPAVGVTPGA
jgi:hypothetical protein